MQTNAITISGAATTEKKISSMEQPQTGHVVQLIELMLKRYNWDKSSQATLAKLEKFRIEQKLQTRESEALTNPQLDELYTILTEAISNKKNNRFAMPFQPLLDLYLLCEKEEQRRVIACKNEMEQVQIKWKMTIARHKSVTTKIGKLPFSWVGFRYDDNWRLPVSWFYTPDSSVQKIALNLPNGQVENVRLSHAHAWSLTKLTEDVNRDIQAMKAEFVTYKRKLDYDPEKTAIAQLYDDEARLRSTEEAQKTDEEMRQTLQEQLEYEKLKSIYSIYEEAQKFALADGVLFMKEVAPLRARIQRAKDYCEASFVDQITKKHCLELLEFADLSCVAQVYYLNRPVEVNNKTLKHEIVQELKNKQDKPGKMLCYGIRLMSYWGNNGHREFRSTNTKKISPLLWMLFAEDSIDSTSRDGLTNNQRFLMPELSAFKKSRAIAIGIYKMGASVVGSKEYTTRHLFCSVIQVIGGDEEASVDATLYTRLTSKQKENFHAKLGFMWQKINEYHRSPTMKARFISVVEQVNALRGEIQAVDDVLNGIMTMYQTQQIAAACRESQSVEALASTSQVEASAPFIGEELRASSEEKIAVNESPEGQPVEPLSPLTEPPVAEPAPELKRQLSVVEGEPGLLPAPNLLSSPISSTFLGFFKPEIKAAERVQLPQQKQPVSQRPAGRSFWEALRDAPTVPTVDHSQTSKAGDLLQPGLASNVVTM